MEVSELYTYSDLKELLKKYELKNTHIHQSSSIMRYMTIMSITHEPYLAMQLLARTASGCTYHEHFICVCKH